MPYTYAKQGSKYTVYKKKKGGERGEKVGSTEGTKEALKKYLAALHANETTNENLMNLANKVERFFKPKDKNIKFKEDLQDLYYTNRPQYDKVKKYYMDQVDAGRQSIDIEDVMNAFEEIERGLNEATSEEDKAVFDAIKTAGFKSWDYEDPESGEVFYAKGRDAGEAARYLRYKYKLEKIDVSKITPTGLGAGITDNALLAIYTNKDIYEMTGDKSKMKNRLKGIVKELMADMPPPAMYAPIKNTDASPIVKAIKSGQLSLQQITNISAYLSKRTAFQPSVEDEKLGAAVVDFLNNNKVPNQILQPIIDQLPKQDVMYTGPGMRENINENKNKMKVNQLRQIIREEIENVMMQQDMPQYTVVSTTDSGGTKTYRDPAMAKVAQALADAMNDQSSKESFFNKFKKDGTVKNVPMRVFNAVISNNMESLSPEFKNWIKYNVIGKPNEFIEVSTTNGSDVVGLRTSYHLEMAQSNKDAGFNLKWPHRGLDPMSSD